MARNWEWIIPINWPFPAALPTSSPAWPVADFKVTPGRADLSWNHNAWDLPNQVRGTQGDFVVYVDRKWPQPVLKAEADGYRPASLLLRALEQTNADFALSREPAPAVMW